MTSAWRGNTRYMPALYFVLGQAGWFACVLGATRDRAYFGVILVTVLIILHLLRVQRPVAEVKLIAAVSLIGCIWESALIHFDVLQYPHGSGFHDLAPAWIVALWALFAAQFNTTYQWLRRRLIAGALLGAFAGPVSFHAGAALGAVRFVKPIPATVALAIGWAVILPSIIMLSRRWDGIGVRPAVVSAVVG